MLSKSLLVISFLVMVSALLLPYKCIAQDSPKTHQLNDTLSANENSFSPDQQVEKPDDEFNVFLLFFGMAAVCFMLGFFLIGFLVFLFLLFALGLFVITRVVSTSVFVGLYKRSFSTGFKTLLVAGGSLAGLVCGIIGFGLVSYLFDLNLNRSTISISGSVFGLVAGALLGLVVFKSLKTAVVYLKGKLKV